MVNQDIVSQIIIKAVEKTTDRPVGIDFNRTLESFGIGDPGSITLFKSLLADITFEHPLVRLYESGVNREAFNDVLYRQLDLRPNDELNQVAGVLYRILNYLLPGDPTKEGDPF
jgi:hypothetical protein